MTSFIRWSGAVTILAGLLVLVQTLLRAGGNPAADTISIIASALGIVAFAGIYAYQRQAGGLWNLLGALLGIAGNALILFGDDRLGGTLYAFGLVFIGIAALRSGAFPRWVAILLILTMFVGMPAFFIDGMEGVLFGLAALLLSIAFMGAGYTMWSSPVEPVAQATA